MGSVAPALSSNPPPPRRGPRRPWFLYAVVIGVGLGLTVACDAYMLDGQIRRELEQQGMPSLKRQVAAPMATVRSWVPKF